MHGKNFELHREVSPPPNMDEEAHTQRRDATKGGSQSQKGHFENMLNKYIYIYIHVCVHVYIYICMYNVL